MTTPVLRLFFHLRVSKTKFRQKQNETSGNENNQGFAERIKKNKFLSKCSRGIYFETTNFEIGNHNEHRKIIL